DFLELGHVDRGLGMEALVFDRGGGAFDQLASDANDGVAGDDAGHLLGALQGGVTVLDDTSDVSDGTGLHVGEALALAADADDLHLAIDALPYQGFDK